MRGISNEEFEKQMEFILKGFKDVHTKIDALVDSPIRLTAAQAQTDENLRNLIAVVDRLF
ncbi:MAG: hypothetical protein JOZ52_11615 [Acidobacteria bacterium]|nr:hypothetical protein [Acidobacteriota bacterium]